MLAASQAQLCGDIDDVLAAHRALVGPRRAVVDAGPGLTVIKATHTTRQTRLLARIDGPVLDPSWAVTEVGLEDIVILVNATMAVPLLFGLFWGAPLLAREFEDGTHNLAWTQGVTRVSWLNHTIGWPLLAAAGWGAAIAALVSWWRGPQNAAGAPVRLATFTFDIQGIVPVAYAVFAVALGIAAGALLRRTLPAIATTFAVFTSLRFLIAEYARPHYLAPVTRSYPPFRDNPAPRGSLVLSNATLGPGGHNYTAGLDIAHIPAACRGYGPRAAQLNSCLASHGFHTQILYQPASRFWVFQGIEAGIFIVLAAALIAVTYRMILARDA